MRTRIDPSKIRFKTTPAPPQPTKAEVARVRRLAKLAGLVFRKSRHRQPTYSLESSTRVFAANGLGSIEKEISKIKAGRKAKPRRRRSG